MSLRAFSALLALLAPMLASGGCATFRPIEDGSIELEDDEGILVLHTATDFPLERVEINGHGFGSGVASGVRMRLYVAKAGEYRFTYVRGSEGYLRFWWRIDAKEDGEDGHDFSFRIDPGAINYPGQLVATSEPLGRFRWHFGLRLPNRSGLVWLTLANRFPTLIERYPLRYTGKQRDEFFDHVIAAGKEP